ncbi:MAG TPA: phospholipid carrier-dependent glycosyltransferase, partial [Gemmatimonadaceae bacterium]|nr:phospholipid carrier-dependent glycosyltransferase [Gemmatimonadaceae bacterium]
AAVVFDEAYYEKFAGAYFTHKFYFDVHPPLGDLMYAGIAKLLQVSPAILTTPAPAPSLRVLPATFGALTIPLVYVILTQLGVGRRIATFGAVAILLDNALLAASRLILLDTFLIGFGLAAIACYLASRDRSNGSRIAWLAASAFLAGCGLSIKWTGSSALAIILVAWFVASVRSRVGVKRFVGEGLILTAIPAIVYSTAFAIHFALLTHSGPGNTFMSVRFQSQLVGSMQYNPSVHMSYWAKMRDVHHAIRYANGGLQNATNPNASPWYTWPIMKHPFALWEDAATPAGTKTTTLLLGNPVVWWGGMVAVLFGAAMIALRRWRYPRYTYAVVFLGGAVAINYLPFAAIHRLVYLYHYLFALIFVVALGSVMIGVPAGWNGDRDGWSFPTRRSAAGYIASIAVMLVGFLYFLPFTYGWTMSVASWDAHFWVLHPHF